MSNSIHDELIIDKKKIVNNKEEKVQSEPGTTKTMEKEKARKSVLFRASRLKLLEQKYPLLR